jgi:beta-galactosidase GanA
MAVVYAGDRPRGQLVSAVWLDNDSGGYPFAAPEYLRQIFTEAKPDDPGTFPWWLSRRYGSLDRLNAAYGTSFTAFEQAAAWHGSLTVARGTE